MYYCIRSKDHKTIFQAELQGMYYHTASSEQHGEMIVGLHLGKDIRIEDPKEWEIFKTQFVVLSTVEQDKNRQLWVKMFGDANYRWSIWNEPYRY